MTAVVVDLLTLATCIVVLLRYGKLAHSHPAIVYLLFHILAFTSRLVAILSGAETLFSNTVGFFEAVTEVEIVRAALLADITLLIMTVAWIRAAMVDGKEMAARSQRSITNRANLSLGHIWRVSAIA